MCPNGRAAGRSAPPTRDLFTRWTAAQVGCSLSNIKRHALSGSHLNIQIIYIVLSIGFHRECVLPTSTSPYGCIHLRHPPAPHSYEALPSFRSRLPLRLGGSCAAAPVGAAVGAPKRVLNLNS